jgi:hypothetical protein
LINAGRIIKKLPAFYFANGNVKEKVLPVPGSLSTIMCPSFFARNSRQSINPRPVAPSLLVPFVV